MHVTLPTRWMSYVHQINSLLMYTQMNTRVKLSAYFDRFRSIRSVDDYESVVIIRRYVSLIFKVYVWPIATHRLIFFRRCLYELGEQNLLPINTTHCSHAATAYICLSLRTTTIYCVAMHKAIPYVKFRVSCRMLCCACLPPEAL